MYRVSTLLSILLAILAGCSGLSAKSIIYPKQELQSTARELMTNVPEPPAGIESMLLEERVGIYTGIIIKDRLVGYEDIITAYLLTPQICEADDGIDVLADILSDQVEFFINGDPISSIGYSYAYEPGDLCIDAWPATVQANVRLAPGLHIVTVRIGIPTQSRTLEYTRAFEVVRGSAEQ